MAPLQPSTRVALAVCFVAVVAACAAGVAIADTHTVEDAPYYDHENESADATVAFLDQDDHYPGAENGSVRYTLAGEEAFADVGAPDGFAARWFIIDAPFVDHSDCDTENLAAFGVDGDGDGEIDEDLLQHTKRMNYADGRISVQFYDDEDFGGEPVRIGPDDRIILEISDESSGGPCTETTEEKGWKTADLFLNGTTDGESQHGFTVETNRTYVCECDSREEAREELGPGVATETSTPGDTETETATETTPEATPTPGETPTPTETPVVTEPSPTVTPTVGAPNLTLTPTPINVTNASEDPLGAGEPGPDPESPTPADGTGFGGFAAVVSLLGSVVLLYRRR